MLVLNIKYDLLQFIRYKKCVFLHILAAGQKCYVCGNGKKNSDCTKIETCKSDEEVYKMSLYFI